MNFGDINVLVTAVGSELAFSVIKAIKLISGRPKISGCDVYKEVVGKYWVDTFFNVPFARDEQAYIEQIKQIIRSERINVIIPTSDAEIMLLSSVKEVFKKELGCRVLTNSFAAQTLFNDKWQAYKWYIANSIGSPKTFEGENGLIDEAGICKLQFPAIIKPKVGGGSRSLYVAKNQSELNNFLKIMPDPIIQEFVGDEASEFTAGTYRTKADEVFVILLKRKLKFGMTNTAEVVRSERLESFCAEVIKKSDLTGVNNIQFRLHHNEPKIIEINPRFSGTTGIRAHFGFNEIEMWLSDIKYGKVKAPKITQGTVLRFMEELYV